MKKKNFFILGVEICIILGGVFLVFLFFQSKNSPETSIVTKIRETIQEKWKKMRDKDAYDAENYNRAMYYANEKACEKISNENTKKECVDYAMIARFVKNPNTADCTLIQDENRGTECRNLIFEKTAIDAKSKKICQNIQDETIKTRCNETIDANILAELSKNNTATAEQCEKMSENFQKECYKLIADYTLEIAFSEAIKTKNLAGCQTLQNADFITKCRDTIIGKMALEGENIGICEYISDENQRKNCTENTTIQKEKKVFNIATNTENISLCNTISMENLKNSCNDIIVLSLVKKQKNASLCQNLKNTENAVICRKILNS